jgi:ribosomal-protein-alanine N-acetyltransferase
MRASATGKMQAVALESATSGDLDALIALEMQCHSHPWSARGLRDALAPGSARRGIFVLREPWSAGRPDRGILAYCAIEVVADEVHVHNLAVAPEARRGGLARRLLALALEVAAHQGAREAHLEVREGNAAARALYRRMGFREVGRRLGYYSSPVEDAVLLSRADLAFSFAAHP